MAKITVDGEVQYAKAGGKGYTILEKVRNTSSGVDFKVYWNVWFDLPTDLAVGDKVEVRGRYSSVIEDFKTRDGSDKKTVKRTINSALLVGDPTLSRVSHEATSYDNEPPF